MPLFWRLYLSASIYTEIFGRLPGTRHSLRFEGPFSPQKGEGANANGVRQMTMAKSDGKEFLTFCRVSSRYESMSPASFGNWDSAQSAATLSFFTASRSLSLSDGMKSGCNLNSKNEHGGRDIFDRFLDEFIVPRSQWLRLVGKLCCARARMRESNSVGVYISTSISEHSAQKAVRCNGRIAKSWNQKRSMETLIIVGI